MSAPRRYGTRDRWTRTLYFVLHPHGQELEGKWVGTSYEGDLVSGWGGLAKSEERARSLIDHLNDNGGTLAT